MNVSPQTQAVLLLTAHFAKPRPEDPKPLSPTEWGKFAFWLRDERMAPESLLAGNVRDRLAGWTDRNITNDRISRLLGRGSALAIAMEKWLRSGLWVLTRADSAYPAKLKQRLRTAAPPVLFGCGNVELLESRGVAVVGSRNAGERDLDYARRLGTHAAGAGITVISGAARGVDEAAMLGAVEANGSAVGVLADSLLRACASTKYRKQLLNDGLVLVSPYYPEAGFTAGNAMGRNKYIYCLADAACVVHSGTNGGTWSGALENLRRAWVPLWVKPSDDPEAGNTELVRRGGDSLPERTEEIDWDRVLRVPEHSSETGRVDMFAGNGQIAEKAPDVLWREYGSENPGDSDPIEEVGLEDTSVVPASAEPAVSFYELFLRQVQPLCRREPKSAAELEKRLDLTRAQLATWLKRAVSEKKLRKLSRPVRYVWVGEDRQRSMF
jgi:predicted Rossmann fold nucleotide-binding protein DprA/Smf involved in DNA uptake